MKKTMITLAAMFAATVTMAAVTSQIVGFAQTQANEGWTFMTPTFVSVNGQPQTMKNVIPDDIFGMSNVYFYDQNGQPMDYDGEGLLPEGATPPLFYYPGDLDYVAGWYDVNMNLYNDYAIDPGYAFWAYSSGGVLISSGQVQTSNIVVNVASGWMMVGNPYPSSLPMSSIVPDEAFGMSNVYFYDQNGQPMDYDGEGVLPEGAIPPLFYYPGDLDYVAGWYDVNMNSYNTLALASGRAFWAYSSGGTLTFNVPAL